MPGQQRGRGDDPMPTQPAGQGGQDRTVRPAQARHGHLTAQHRDLVAQDEDLGVLGRSTAREQSEPAEQPDRDQIQKSEQHSWPSCHDHVVPSNPQVTTLVMSFGTPQ